MSNVSKKNHAFFERNSWYHRTKVLQPDGTTKYGKKGGFTTPEEAEKSYKHYEKVYADAVKTFYNRSPLNEEINLTDYLDYWLHNVYGLRVENSTRILAEHILENWTKPCMDSEIKMKFLTTSFLDNLLEKASKISNSSGYSVQGLLYIAFKDAQRDGIITVNPMVDVKKYPRKKANVRILSRVTLQKFLKASKDNPWFLEILLALFCGLRKGEILGLKFSDFDMEHGTLFIQRQLSYEPVIDEETGKLLNYRTVGKEPKTPNSYRKMRVPKIILEQISLRQQYNLQCMLQCGDAYKNYDYVTCQTNGEPRSQAAMNTAITKLCKRNGIPHISVHSLRHMFATILLENGVSLAKISALLGHSSVYTTFEYYCDVMNENDKIIDFINERFPVCGESGVEDGR